MAKLALVFSTFLFLSTAYADSLSLYFIRSPYGINWRTPWTMATTTIKNQLAPKRGRGTTHSISHTYVRIKCDSIGVDIYRGMTSDGNDEERQLLFKKKYGLGVMFHSYKGRLEKDQDILRDLEDYYGSSRLSHLEIDISSSTCERLVQYANEYEERGYGKMYSGLQADPLKGEGAGCSAFAVSFLRVGGLMTPFMEEWKDIVDVPLYLVGGPMTGKRVSIFKVLRSYRARWSNKIPHYHLEAWNPEGMHRWLLRTHEEVRHGEFRDFDPRVDEYEWTKILRLDMSHRPTPSGPIWQI